MLPSSSQNAPHSALSGGHPFALTQAQLYDEERRLRLLAESQVRSLVAVLTELAQLIAPEAIDAQRRLDPTFPKRMDAQEWRAFLTAEVGKQRGQKLTWQVEEKLSAGEPSAVEGLDVVSSEQPASPEPPEPQTPNPSPPPQAQELIAPRCFHPSTYTPIPLPSKAPKPYPWKGDAWHRRILIMSVFASTGWAMRLEMLAAVSKAEGIGSSAGSLKRMVGKLVSEGYLHHESAQLGDTKLALHWLTATGKRLVEAVGIVPVPSEWEELLALHSGERQHAHAILCLVASHQARQHGYATQVCPPVPGSAAPDLLLINGDERIYVEVEAESGDPERRMIKWRNLAELQGFVALCAPTPEIRSRLVAEAKAAKTKGRATDLKTGRSADKLWIETW